MNEYLFLSNTFSSSVNRTVGFVFLFSFFCLFCVSFLSDTLNSGRQGWVFLTFVFPMSTSVQDCSEGAVSLLNDLANQWRWLRRETDSLIPKHQIKADIRATDKLNLCKSHFSQLIWLQRTLAASGIVCNCYDLFLPGILMRVAWTVQLSSLIYVFGDCEMTIYIL